MKYPDKIKWTFRIAAFLAICGTLTAQHADWENVTSGEEVTAILFHGPYGMVGTTGGLVFLDVNEGTSSFSTKSNSGLPALPVTAIALTDTVEYGQLIGTDGGGLAYRDTNDVWEVFDTQNSNLPSDRITAIAMIDEIVVVGTADAGVAWSTDGLVWVRLYSGSTPPLPSDEIHALTYSGLKDRLWIGTSNGLVETDSAGTTWIVHGVADGLPSDFITALAIDNQGQPYAGTPEGVAYLPEFASWIPVQGFPTLEVLAVALDDADTLYVGTRNTGLWKYIGSGTWEEFYTGNSGLPADFVKTLFFDRIENTLWIGTFGGGLASLSDNTITSGYSTSNSGLAHNNVTHVAPFPDGGMWFLSRHPETGINLLSLFDNTDWTVYTPFDSGLPENERVTGMKSRGTDLYICTESQGLFHFDQNADTWHHHAEPVLPTSFLNDLDIDGDGRIWIASGSGILHYDGRDIGTLATIHSGNSGLPDDFIRFIAVSGSDNIWAGSEGTFYNAVLYHWDGTDWTTYDPGNTPEIPDAFIRDMDLDGLGRPWVATENGAVFFNGTDWRRFTPANSVLPDNGIAGIFAEPGGIVWMAVEGFDGPQGMVRFTPVDSTRITRRDSGLPTNHVRGITRDTDGHRWFATDQGATKFTGVLTAQEGPALQLSTNAVDFGTIHADSTARADVILTNIGDEALTLNDLYLMGPDTASYKILSTYASPMAPETQQTITLMFDPASEGSRSASLRILSNAPSSPDEVALTGAASLPRFELDPDFVDFGLIHPDSTALDSVLMSNSGTYDLEITDLEVIGTDGYAFYLWTMDNTPIPPGSSRMLYVEFTPEEPGTKSAWGVLSSNAPGSPHTLSLSGRAGVPQITPDRTRLDFGSVPVGMNASRTLTITNTGSAEWISYSRSFSGPDASLFSLAQETEPDTLQPGESITRGFFFTPTSIGEKSALFIIEHNASTSPDTLELRGEGTPRPEEGLLQTGTDLLDFGTVTIGVTSSASIMLMNIGLSQLDFNQVRLAGDPVFTFAPLPVSSLDPDSMTYVWVSFSPNEATPFSGSLIITSNSETSPDTIRLSGTGRAPDRSALQIEPESLDFGTVQNGQTDTLSFTVRSTGSVSLFIQDVRLAAGSPAYTLTKSFTGQVAVGNTMEYEIAFTPTSDADYAAVCIITSNAPTSPDSIRISGRGRVIEFNFDASFPVAGTGNFDMNFTIDPPIPGIEIWVHYTQAGSTQWNAIPCTYQPPQYQAVLPDSILQLRGLTYYMEVLDSTGATIFRNGSPDAPAAFLPVQIEKEESPVVPQERLYTMISVPCNLENSRVLEVLEDDLGPWSPKSWRLFRWNRTDGKYDEFIPATDTQLGFTPGAAYWLITQRTRPFSIENGSSTPALTPFPVTLYPGWNQIGNPFSFPVAWNAVEKPETVLSPVGYTGHEYTYNHAVLEPWRGYFVYVNGTAAVTIRIPPVEAGVAALPKESAEGGFELRIAIRGEETGRHDTQNFVGMRPGITGFPNAENFREAPPVSGGLNLSIMEEGVAFAGNFKPLGEDGAFWDLEISSADRREAARLSLTGTETLPDDFGIWLLDRDRECLIPLEKTETVLDVPGEGKKRSLRLITGLESYAESHSGGIPLVPVEYALYHNYPNPFNPETRIVYALAGKGPIRLAVYNIMGQHVITLIDGVETTGLHTTAWDGRDGSGIPVPSGVYICRMETDVFSVSRKMILAR